MMDKYCNVLKNNVYLGYLIRTLMSHVPQVRSLFLSSYPTHCEQEVRLEYNSKGYHYATVHPL